MKNFTFTLRDIFATAESCLAIHRDSIRVYTDTRYNTLGDYVVAMQRSGQIDELKWVLKRTGNMARQLVTSLIHEAFHDRYLTLSEWNSEEMRVQAAMLFVGDDIDDVLDTMRSILDHVLRDISKLLDTASDNRYSLIKYDIMGNKLVVIVGDDIRHVVFKERHGNKRWTGPRYTVGGNRIQDDMKLNYDYNTVMSDEEENDNTFLDQLNQALHTQIDEVVLENAPSIVLNTLEPDAGITSADDGVMCQRSPNIRVDVLGVRTSKSKPHQTKLQ